MQPSIAISPTLSSSKKGKGKSSPATAAGEQLQQQQQRQVAMTGDSSSLAGATTSSTSKGKAKASSSMSNGMQFNESAGQQQLQQTPKRSKSPRPSPAAGGGEQHQGISTSMKRSNSMRKSASAASSSAVSTGSSSCSFASTSRAPAAVASASTAAAAAAGDGGTTLAPAPPRSPVTGPARQASLSVPSSPNHHYNSPSGSGTGSIPQRSVSGNSNSAQSAATTNHQTITSDGNGNAFGPGPSYSNPRSYPHSPNSNPSIRLPRPSEAFARELSDVLQHTFIPSILPTAEEYQIKEGARKFLEGLAERVTPGAKLLPFGSQANGMALKNSDMDLCYISPPGQPPRLPSELVEILGRLIETEAPHFQVKMLPRARIPIIKLNMPPNATNPNGISCDIGFENRLALENTRLLLTYAMADTRLRTLVLFLKVWCKRRKINNPYLGTLSSYGFVLLAIHFLINVRRPPVLPNLQRLHPPKPMQMGQTEFEGRDIYFFDDLDLLPHYWQSTNRDCVGELLIAFFAYYFKEFRYNFDIISIRTDGGLLSKVSKGWQQDESMEELVNAPRNLNRLCIEDPFQTDYNVARTVTVDGLFTIRGEIARAHQILKGGSRSDVNSIIAELVEEREDYLVQAPPPSFGNRRRSAPSPRLQPSVLPTHKDFQAWAMAKGVPHAPGGPMPVFSQEVMQANGLLPSGVAAAASGSGNPDEHGTGIPLAGNAHAEALARYQQASQALSQANLQQQQQAQHQQILANLHASIAASSLRGGFRQPPNQRRFHEHGYRNNNNFRQQQTGQYQNQAYGQPQSPTLPSSAHLLHPSSHHASLSRSTAGGTNPQRPQLLDRRSSWDGSNADRDLRQTYRGSSSVSEAGVSDLGTATAPTSPVMVDASLPAFPRSAPHGAANGSSSSMAGYANGDRLGRDQRAGQAGYGRSQSHYAGYNNSRSLPNRPLRVQQQQQQQQASQRAQNETFSPKTGYPMAAFPTGLGYAALNAQQGQMYLLQQQLAQQHGLSMPVGLPFPTSPVQHQYQALPHSYAPRHNARSASVSTVSHPASEAGDYRSPNGVRTYQISPPQPVPVTQQQQPQQAAAEETRHEDSSSSRAQSPPPNGPIRFGNFDAASYSSEPKDMASLGLYEGVPGVDSPQVISAANSVSGATSGLLDESAIPDDLPQLPPARPLAVSMNAARAAARFRPELADIPASPGPRGSPVSPAAAAALGSRRPSHTRRKSAGDEKSLGLEDITFFGNIPVQRNEAERERAMAALLKESSKDYRTSEGGQSMHGSQAGSRRGPQRTGSTSSGSTENETSSVPVSVSAVPDSTSSSAASVSSETSASEPTQQGESPFPIMPIVDIQLSSPTPPPMIPMQLEQRSNTTPTPASATRQGRGQGPTSPRLQNSTSPRLSISPKVQAKQHTGSTKIKDAGTATFLPSFGAIQTRSQSEKPRRRTGSNT